MGSEPSTKYPPGTVSRQEPPPGTLVPENSVVRYWLAATHAPPPSVTAPRITAKPSVAKYRVYVPDVIGFELNQGFNAISKAGLVPRFAGKKRSNRRAGEIMHQRPPAGTPVKPGSEVWVWVASGPPPPWPIILAAAAVVYVLVKIVKKLIWPVRVELCPVLDSGDQKLEKVGPLVAAGGD